LLRIWGIYVRLEREVWLGFAVSRFLYDRLHLVSQDVPFYLKAEQVIWRPAAASVMSTPLFAGSVIVLCLTVS